MNFRKHLNRLRGSKVAKNTAASYLAFISTTVTGLLSIPLSVHYLSRQELGLWAVIAAVNGYLAFMELGLGFATGRKMADGIIAKDKVEIDRWWTLTRVILSIQGIIVIIAGLAMTPLFMSFMAKDFPDKGQALFLFVGIVLMQGVKMPFQGVEGILTAQERFHWVPMRQTIIFWVELGVFAACITSGVGLYSMLWSRVAMLVVIWLINWVLLAQSDPKLGWDSSGLQWERFRSLFGFSLSISGVGYVDVFIKSLPVIILSKMGGLALVPVYTLSIKISTVLVSIGRRNYQSFYPALQKMFIQGEREKFRDKYASIGLVTVATGLGISGIILCMNRTGVELLAKPEFYAGPIATAWFAVATITIPVSGLLQTPLLVAGQMGKSVLVAIVRAAAAVVFCILAHRRFGIDGLAAVMALLPLLLGAYAYVRGAKECGCTPGQLSGFVSVWTMAGILVVLAGGAIIYLMPGHPLFVLHMAHKTVSLPSWSELLVGGSISLAALALLLHALNQLRKGGAAKPSAGKAGLPQAL